MAKRIVIQTNDPQKKSLTLMVKGLVKKFATIRPKRVQLTGPVDKTIRQTVAIIPEREYPFKIIAATAKQGNDIKLALEEKMGGAGIEYRLTVDNTRREVGRYHDLITLKTDSEQKPELQIRVYGNIIAPRQAPAPASGSGPPKPASSEKDTSGGVKAAGSSSPETGSKQNRSHD